MGRQCDDNQYGGAAGILVSELISYSAAADLLYNRYFGKDFHLSAALNFEYTGYKNKFNTLNGTNFLSHSLKANGLQTGAYVIMHHDFILDYSHIGGYASLAADFRNIVGFKAVGRWDNTPKYKGAEEFFRPSVEVWFDVRNTFFKDNTAVSALKLKYGFGKSGMEKYVPYQLTGNYLSSTWYAPEKGTETFHDGVNRLDSEELHVTAEAGFLSDRIKFGVTYFDKNTTDTFLMYSMGYKKENSKTWRWGGCEKVFERMSAVGNQGYEFDLSARIIDRKNVKWNVSANLAYSLNAVTAYNSDDFYGKQVGSGVYCTANFIGMPVSNLFGFVQAGNGNFKDVTGDGRIDSADMVSLGNTVPKVYGGLNTDFSVGRLSFEASIDGAAGHKLANINALVKEGVIGPDGYYVLTPDFVEKADFLRLGLIGVRYNVPVKLKWLSELSVRLSCHNVAMLTSYSGWNPDTNCFGTSTLSNGLDYGSYPVFRTVMLGVSVKF